MTDQAAPLLFVMQHLASAMATQQTLPELDFPWSDTDVEAAVGENSTDTQHHDNVNATVIDSHDEHYGEAHDDANDEHGPNGGAETHGHGHSHGMATGFAVLRLKLMGHQSKRPGSSLTRIVPGTRSNGYLLSVVGHLYHL